MGGTIHGDRYKRLYRIWQGMKSRCLWSGREKWHKSYASLGVTICDEWASSYLAFKEWALRNGYRDDLQIDRIDNNLGYKPDNCRFVTHHENMMNRRNSIVINYGGEDVPLLDICAEKGICYRTAVYRLRRGLPINLVLSQTNLRYLKKPEG